MVYHGTTKKDWAGQGNTLFVVNDPKDAYKYALEKSSQKNPPLVFKIPLQTIIDSGLKMIPDDPTGKKYSTWKQSFDAYGSFAIVNAEELKKHFTPVTGGFHEAI